MTTTPNPQFDPDAKLAEELVLAMFSWTEEDAAKHYAVYKRACEAVVKGVRLERSRCAHTAKLIAGRALGEKLFREINAGPRPLKEVPV